MSEFALAQEPPVPKPPSAYDIGGAAGTILRQVLDLNEAAEKAKACGWTVKLYVNGTAGGDHVSLRLERETWP